MGTSSYSIRAAEKKALEGKNEEQDSLEVMHAHMMEFGVGIVSVALFAFCESLPSALSEAMLLTVLGLHPATDNQLTSTWRTARDRR